MILTLLLSWFAILLAAGVGGGLLRRGRGFALGLVCAMFWMVLVQATVGTDVWRQPWLVATLLVGAAVMILMGGWAGRMSVNDPSGTTVEPFSCAPGDGCPDATHQAVGRFAAVIHQFDDWLVEHREDADPWPAFGEFIRGALFQCCKATHVKPYRLLDGGDAMVPLRGPDPLTEGNRVSVREGVLGHVVTTGQSYVGGDGAHGELIQQLAQEHSEPIMWCFAVSQGIHRLGAVSAGHVDISPESNQALLRAVEQLVSQCWCLLGEAVRSRAAEQDDPGSGLFNRAAFLRAAERSLQESYAQGEPVAVVVIAVEGLRELNDSGRWEVAEELVREVAHVLRCKVRMDDGLGRFDDSRLIWLLRRVDAALASLIVKQVMSRLTALCNERGRWRSPVAVRCGVVGSGMENPDLRTLVSRALVESRRARLEQLTIAGELDAQPAEGVTPVETPSASAGSLGRSLALPVRIEGPRS